MRSSAVRVAAMAPGGVPGAWQRDHPARVSGRHPGSAQDGSALRPGPKPVAIVIPLRTLVTVAVFAGLVALAILSAGTLLSIFVAVVLALGLDPPVTALVARGWRGAARHWRPSPALFVAVFVIVLVTAGPLWDQIIAFVHELPAYWDEITQTDGFQQLDLDRAGPTTRSATRSRISPPGCPRRPRRSSASPGGAFGSILSLVRCPANKPPRYAGQMPTRRPLPDPLCCFHPTAWVNSGSRTAW